MPERSIVLAVPYRTDYYENYARILDRAGLLRCCLLWTRRGIEGVPRERHRLATWLGVLHVVSARTLPPYQAEAFRFALYPSFDRWASLHLRPGDHVLSSYAYANACFRKARRQGGMTLLDAGNSHPENFWKILSEEHARWTCKYPPVPKFYIKRAMSMMRDVDLVLAPSRFVADSFRARGFSDDQILDVFYPVDLSNFTPSDKPRPADRPFTIVNTGGLSLRKGTPYLLEAFRLVRERVPDARLLLTDAVTDSAKPLLDAHADLPIDWAPYLPQRELADRLRSADLFILPSLEEGLVRTALQAMSCGIPVILTPNTGANDYVEEGVNGSVVPLQNARAIADKALSWWQRIQNGCQIETANLQSQLGFERLERHLMAQLEPMLHADIPPPAGGSGSRPDPDSNPNS